MILFRLVMILFLSSTFFTPSIFASDYEEIRKRNGDVERVLGEHDGTDLIRNEGSVEYYKTAGEHGMVKDNDWDNVGYLEKD